MLCAGTSLPNWLAVDSGAGTRRWHANPWVFSPVICKFLETREENSHKSSFGPLAQRAALAASWSDPITKGHWGAPCGSLPTIKTQGGRGRVAPAIKRKGTPPPPPPEPLLGRRRRPAASTGPGGRALPTREAPAALARGSSPPRFAAARARRPGGS